MGAARIKSYIQSGSGFVKIYPLFSNAFNTIHNHSAIPSFLSCEQRPRIRSRFSVNPPPGDDSKPLRARKFSIPKWRRDILMNLNLKLIYCACRQKNNDMVVSKGIHN